MDQSQTAGTGKVNQQSIDQIEQFRQFSMPSHYTEKLALLAICSADRNQNFNQQVSARLELVQSLKEQGKVVEAIKTLKEIDGLYKRNGKSDHATLLDIADLSIVSQSFDDAMQYYGKLIHNNLELEGQIGVDYNIVATLGLITAHISRQDHSVAVNLLKENWNNISKISAENSDLVVDRLANLAVLLSRNNFHELEIHCLLKARYLCADLPSLIRVNRLLSSAYEQFGDALKAVDIDTLSLEQLEGEKSLTGTIDKNEIFINRLRLRTLLGNEQALAELEEVLVTAKTHSCGLTSELADYQLILIERLIAYGREAKATSLIQELKEFLETNIPDEVKANSKCEDILSALKNCDFLGIETFQEALLQKGDLNDPATTLEPEVRRWALKTLNQYSACCLLSIQLGLEKTNKKPTELEMRKLIALQTLQYGDDLPIETRLMKAKYVDKMDESGIRDLRIEELDKTSDLSSVKRLKLCIEIAESFYDSRRYGDTVEKNNSLLHSSIDYLRQAVDIFTKSPYLANQVDLLVTYAQVGNLTFFINRPDSNENIVNKQKVLALLESAYRTYQQKELYHPGLMNLCASLRDLSDSSDMREKYSSHAARIDEKLDEINEDGDT